MLSHCDACYHDTTQPHTIEHIAIQCNLPNVGLLVIVDLLHALQVRYESRRRLAETRPRVRGQFVKAGTAAAQSIAAQVLQYSAVTEHTCVRVHACGRAKLLCLSDTQVFANASVRCEVFTEACGMPHRAPCSPACMLAVHCLQYVSTFLGLLVLSFYRYILSGPPGIGNHQDGVLSCG